MGLWQVNYLLQLSHLPLRPVTYPATIPTMPTKALFNKYPLETVANTNYLFKITPNDQDTVANITLNVN